MRVIICNINFNKNSTDMSSVPIAGHCFPQGSVASTKRYQNLSACFEHDGSFFQNLAIYFCPSEWYSESSPPLVSDPFVRQH